STDTVGDGRRETSVWSGAFDAVPLAGGDGLLVGGFHDLSWNLYRYPVDTAARLDHFALQPGPPAGQWTWATGPVARAKAVGVPYKGRMTLDVAAGSAV